MYHNVWCFWYIQFHQRLTAHLGSLQVYILFVWQKTNWRDEWKMDINMKLQYAEVTYTSIHLRNNGKRHSLKSLSPDSQLWMLRTKIKQQKEDCPMVYQNEQELFLSRSVSICSRSNLLEIQKLTALHCKSRYKWSCSSTQHYMENSNTQINQSLAIHYTIHCCDSNMWQRYCRVYKRSITQCTVYISSWILSLIISGNKM